MGGFPTNARQAKQGNVAAPASWREGGLAVWRAGGLAGWRAGWLARWVAGWLGGRLDFGRGFGPGLVGKYSLNNC